MDLGAAGCADAPTDATPATTGDQVTTEVQAAPVADLVTRDDIDRFSPDSPRHALLTWWRASQFADYPQYVRAFANPFRRRLIADPRTKSALVQFAGSINSARPKIVSVEESGDGATLYTESSYRAQRGDDVIVVSSIPRGATRRPGGRS